jgi:hypothetical protein
MAMSIQNPAKCEVFAAIGILHMKKFVSVYGKDVMNSKM